MTFVVQVGLSARLSYQLSMRQPLCFWVGTARGMLDHCVTSQSGVLRTCACTPCFAALDWPATIQASLWIALFDSGSKSGIRCFGHVDNVTSLSFLFAFHVSPRRRFFLLLGSFDLFDLHSCFDLCPSPLRVPHRTTQNGQPAENGRPPALCYNCS